MYCGDGQLRPDLGKAHRTRAWVLKGLGKYLEAMDAYLQAFETSDSHVGRDEAKRGLKSCKAWLRWMMKRSRFEGSVDLNKENDLSGCEPSLVI